MQIIGDRDAAEMFFFFLERNCKPKAINYFLTFFKSRVKFLRLHSGGFAVDGFTQNLFTLSKDCTLPKSQRLHHCDFLFIPKKVQQICSNVDALALQISLK